MTEPTREQAGQRLGKWIIRNRWPILVLSVVLAATAMTGVRRLSFSDDYRAFFSSSNPQLESYEAIQNIYTRADNILVAIEPVNGGSVLTPPIMAAIEDLTESAWQVPYARRVDSMTNFQHTWADGDELVVEDLVRDAASGSIADMEAAGRVALAEPLLRDRLIASDAGSAGVNITLQLPGEAPTETAEAVAAIRELAARIESDHPDVRTHLTGLSMLNYSFSESAERDMSTLVPLMLAGIALLMGFLLRSALATGAAMVVLVLSAGTAMGLAGWAGIAITPPSSVAPTMILTIAIADAIHLLVTMFASMREGQSRDDALVESMRVNLQPVFLTSLTTAIGFLSLNFSDAPPFRDLGNITAAGVAAAFVLSILFLPALIAVLPVRATAKSQTRADGWQDRLADFVIARRRPLLAGSAVLVMAAGFLVTRNELNDQFVRYFGERLSFRQDTEYVMANLTGLYQVEFSLSAGESGGVVDPRYLAKLDEFAAWWETQPSVVQVQSLAPTMKRINRSMHGDDPAWYRLPEGRQLAAQYLLLYELSLPYGLDLNDQINVDQSATRFTVTLTDVTAREIREAAAAGEAWLRANAPDAMHAVAASPAVMFAHISGRNIRSMLFGTALAFVLVSATLVIALRSPKYGLLSLLPNIVPAIVAFGLWGLLVGQVNVALSVVTAMTFGIVVDDSIHFLSKYLRARREHGFDSRDAVRYTFRNVGSALLFTSLILAGGFLVLATSQFDLNGGMGKLTAITIAAAVLADFFMLPALLMAVAGRESEATEPTTKPMEAIMTWISKRRATRRRRLAPGTTTTAALLITAALSFPPSAASAAQVGGGAPVAGPDASAAERGLEIATEADRRDTGFGDLSAELAMILRNRHGEESTRRLRNRTLEGDEDGDRTLVVFDEPADVSGTALLTFSHGTEPDDQWLYLPALGRVKRISSSNKSGPFVGSEFAYEDISSQEVAKYTYRYIGEETVEGVSMFVIERDPVDEDSGYARQVAWYDQAEYRPMKVDYYDRKNALLKTLTFHRYRQYLDQFWRAAEMRMVNHQTGKSTTLLWSDYRFDNGFTERDFDRNTLKRVR
jgi:predicted RND superfamily exporter protein